jgi:Spy/CpxP family protein refolding chaperone
MRVKLPWILFALSLLLNLFFLAGAFHDDVFDTDRGQRSDVAIETIAGELGLSEAQRAALTAFRDNLVKDFNEKRAAEAGDHATRAEMLVQLGQDTYEPERVSALLKGRYDKRIAFWVAKAGDMHAFLQTLSPEQRSQFLKMAEEPTFFKTLFGLRRS